MLRLVYNALWYPALPAALLAAGGRDPAIRRQRMGRLGRVTPATGGQPTIWLHASSVGEVEGIRPVAAGLLEDLPGAILIVTTMTPMGRELAVQRIAGIALAQLAPLDHPLSVRAFLRSAEPALVLIAEGELWPNYFIESRRHGARVAIVNGRISSRSFRRYRLTRRLWARTLTHTDLIMAQTEADAERYLKLGAPAERVVVTGNTKFDHARGFVDGALPKELAFVEKRSPVLVAGSTGPGEEAVVLEAFAHLRRAIPELLLVLAPRHVERLPEVRDLLANRGLPFVTVTEPGSQGEGAAAAVLLVDTIGILRALYRQATVAFVGGSLYPGRGGQNLGEPAALGIPVLFGPHHDKQRQMAEALLAAGGASVVEDSASMAAAVGALIADEQARLTMGQSARAAFASLSGGVQRSLSHLRALTRLI